MTVTVTHAGRSLQSGFTLLEVLVALAVFGFLLLGLGRGVDFGLRVWTRQERSVAARSELDAVDRTLRNLVDRLDPNNPVSGTPHSVGFTSTLPSMALLATGEADMAVGAEPVANGKPRLVLRWRSHLHAQILAPRPPPETAALLEGIERFDVAYWRADDGGWADTWSGQVPPALIRFRILFPAGDARHWADIVVSPMRTPG